MYNLFNKNSTFKKDDYIVIDKSKLYDYVDPYRGYYENKQQIKPKDYKKYDVYVDDLLIPNVLTINTELPDYSTQVLAGYGYTSKLNTVETYRTFTIIYVGCDNVPRELVLSEKDHQVIIKEKE